MWVLNLCLPLAFMTSLLFAVNFMGLENVPQGSNQLAKNEPVSDSDGKCAASHRGFISRCRLVVSVTLFFVALVAGGLLIGTISARASTYLVAFMLVLFGISCDRVIVSN